MKDAFSRYHPLVSFLFFALVLTISMVTMHPICIGISLICAASYALYLSGIKAVRIILFGALPMLVMTAIFNPLFNHRGATILWYFPGGNPLTLESVFYGIMAGSLFAAVILWFFCLNKVFTSDKLIYLFGRAIPGLSLVLSMILRFVPRFTDRFKKIAAARKCLGYDEKKLRGGIAVLSALITWTLEDGLTTASSMKSRGYGLPGRTAYTTYRITARDISAMAVMALLGAAVLLARAAGVLSFVYYPTPAGDISPLSALIFAAFTVLGAVPLIIDIKEDIAWKRIK